LALVIRRATVADLDRLVELSLNLQLYSERTNPLVWKITNEGKSRGLKKEVEDMLADADGRLIVAAKDGAILGFAFGTVTCRTTHSPSIVAHISRVYVIEQSRRQGVGTRLVEALCRFFDSEGAKEVTLRYVVGNKVAEQFWTGLSFKPVLMTALTSISELKMLTYK